jgi:hypothetical protein
MEFLSTAFRQKILKFRIFYEEFKNNMFADNVTLLLTNGTLNSFEEIMFTLNHF